MSHKSRPKLSVEEIQENWTYDKETGLFYWKISGKGILKGKPTGHSDGRYIVLQRRDAWVYAHRAAFVLVNGAWPTKDVDHINGDRLDNRFANLREASAAQNLRNRSVKSDSLTKVKGVTQDKRDGRFYAYIDFDGRRLSLGGFDNIADAADARIVAEKLHHEGFSYQDRLASTTGLEPKPNLTKSPEAS